MYSTTIIIIIIIPLCSFLFQSFPLIYFFVIYLCVLGNQLIQFIITGSGNSDCYYYFSKIVVSMKSQLFVCLACCWIHFRWSGKLKSTCLSNCLDLDYFFVRLLHVLMPCVLKLLAFSIYGYIIASTVIRLKTFILIFILGIRQNLLDNI